jgi:hypothetical protein
MFWLFFMKFYLKASHTEHHWGRFERGEERCCGGCGPLASLSCLVFGEVIGSLVDRGELLSLFLWWEETWHASLYDLGYVFGLLQRTTVWVTAGDPVVQSTLLLGPLYTKNQGQCSTQIKHSYWCKSWNQPQGLYTRSQGWTRKNLFNLPKVTNKCWTLWPCIGPKAGKWIPSNLGPLGPMFQHLLISWSQCSSIY